MTELLTDDEVIAIAAGTGPWNIVLPTVDVTSALSLAGAAIRGARSLSVRHLVELHAATPLFLTDSAACIAEIVGSGRRTVAYVAGGIPPFRLSGGVTVLARIDSDPDTAIFDVISAAGIHETARMSSASTLAAFLAFVRHAFDDGVHDEQGALLSDHTLFVVDTVGDSARVLRVDRGLITTGTFLAGGSALEFIADSSTTRWAEFEDLISRSSAGSPA